MPCPQHAPSLNAAADPVRVPSPVPDIEVLRRAALHASWRRDRRVAQRRTSLRWAMWYGIRSLPLMLMAVATAFWLLREAPDAAPKAPHPTLQPANFSTSGRIQPGQNKLTPAPPATTDAVPSANATPPRGEPAIDLRLASPFQPALPADGTAASVVRDGGPVAPDLNSRSPQLKPDNWLHSKEP